MPAFLQASLIPQPLLDAEIVKMLQLYQSTGRLPSRPDSDRAVGYDYGLLLYNLAKRKHPNARDIYEKMLSVRDITGAWVEYYDNHQPNGTRCRPWESAINIESALVYLQGNAT